ncbi:unnamed protein product [Vitrella brassicaformis CCMP3155]|uniref:Uncharacterized protein n=1 Tax=Vitrella brassicaformis (strain CCMP3155) TaxID=1169540 RepID=A0A0G4F1T2_VITBC|nr:unnamed protein product [Vitrella brassicaformis CCMP3155]|eukprot:CEM05702.1 unnamed protein product [Vitrella brassicaformis CCMP3155]
MEALFAGLFGQVLGLFGREDGDGHDGPNNQQARDLDPRHHAIVPVHRHPAAHLNVNNDPRLMQGVGPFPPFLAGQHGPPFFPAAVPHQLHQPGPQLHLAVPPHHPLAGVAAPLTRTAKTSGVGMLPVSTGPVSTTV